MSCPTLLLQPVVLLPVACPNQPMSASGTSCLFSLLSCFQFALLPHSVSRLFCCRYVDARADMVMPLLASVLGVDIAIYIYDGTGNEKIVATIVRMKRGADRRARRAGRRRGPR